MATVVFDLRGVTIGLNHEETAELVGVGTGGGLSEASILAVLTKFGVAGPVGVAIAAALALYVLAESAAIKSKDAGYGVWLNSPPPLFGIFLPKTRWEPVKFDGNSNVGTMLSGLGDQISWNIERGVGADGDCKFILFNECDWAKAYLLREGPDKFWVKADGHSAAENSAWFSDLAVSSIEFHKPQWIGGWGPAELSIDDFDGVGAKDVTTFRWVKD